MQLPGLAEDAGEGKAAKGVSAAVVAGDQEVSNPCTRMLYRKAVVSCRFDPAGASAALDQARVQACGP